MFFGVTLSLLHSASWCTICLFVCLCVLAKGCLVIACCFCCSVRACVCAVVPVCTLAINVFVGSYDSGRYTNIYWFNADFCCIRVMHINIHMYLCVCVHMKKYVYKLPLPSPMLQYACEQNSCPCFTRKALFFIRDPTFLTSSSGFVHIVLA